MKSKKRTGKVSRKTSETDIVVEVNLDGTGKSGISTGLPFFDHMLSLLARHSLADITIKARGDLEVDAHHTVEDVGLCLGEAIDKALGDRRGIVRYGSCCVPMDECLSRAVIDLGGRPYLVLDMATTRRKAGEFDLDLVPEFFRAFTVKGRMNLHVAQLYGKEAHHACESVFKAVARVLRIACERDPRVRGVPSSKGRI